MEAVRLGCGVVRSSFAVEASGDDPVVVPAADGNEDSSESPVLGVLCFRGLAESAQQGSPARQM